MSEPTVKPLRLSVAGQRAADFLPTSQHLSVKAPDPAQNCVYCYDPILGGQTWMTAFGAHLECELRDSLGDQNHQEGFCTCFGGGQVGNVLVSGLDAHGPAQGMPVTYRQDAISLAARAWGIESVATLLDAMSAGERQKVERLIFEQTS